jgi:hypothetical protein
MGWRFGCRSDGVRCPIAPTVGRWSSEAASALDLDNVIHPRLGESKVRRVNHCQGTWRPWALITAFVAIVSLTAACGSSGPGSKINGASHTPAVSAPIGTPPPVPATGAYLGAWVNPNPGHSEISQLPSFAQAIGKVPAILSLYTPWAKPAPISHMQDIVSHGAIPLVSWGCEPTAAVISGQEDGIIASYARSLKAFGHPVLLRWFWEMNLNIPKDVNCLGTGGPADFIAAWKHVREMFQLAGANNVAFVWCPGISNGVAEINSYFPGAAYVDWIGVDGYDRKSQGQQAFADVFGAWYATYSVYGKPLMIGETAAHADDQASYLLGIESSLPAQFPDVKALIYFDATGPGGTWALSESGLHALSRLAANPYFSAHG